MNYFSKIFVLSFFCMCTLNYSACCMESGGEVAPGAANSAVAESLPTSGEEKDEKNFIEKLKSKLLEHFSKIEIYEKSPGNPGNEVLFNYETDCASVRFDEIKEKCNSLGEAKKYLLRQICDLAIDFYYYYGIDKKGPMASEEDLKNYQIVKNWDNKKIDSILSNIDMRDCKFSEDVEQSITKIFGRRSQLANSI